MKLILGIAAIILIAAGAYASVQLNQPQSINLQTSFEYPTPQPLAPFSLTDQRGNSFSNADLQGKWSLFFIGLAAVVTMFSTGITCLDAFPRSLAVGFSLISSQFSKWLNYKTILLVLAIERQ